MTSKLTAVARYLAISAVIGLFSLPAFAQVPLPDYSKWTLVTSSVNVTHNDKMVSLKFDHYQNRSDQEKQLSVNVLDNNKKESWLAFYVIEYTDQSKRNEYHLFEYKNGKWEYVKNFSESQDLKQDSIEFLKSKYNLVW